MLPAGPALQTYPLFALPHLGKWNQVRVAPRSTCSARCGPRYRLELPLGGPWALYELPGAHRGHASGRMSSSGRGPAPSRRSRAAPQRLGTPVDPFPQTDTVLLPTGRRVAL